MIEFSEALQWGSGSEGSMVLSFFPRISTSFLYLLFYAVCLAGWPGALSCGGDSASPAEMAHAIFGAVERKYASLRTLRYDVIRRATSDRQSSEDRWTFSYMAPDRVRVDAQTPVERTIIVNGDEITEYIPLLRKAVVTRLGSLSAPEREKIVSSVLARIALEGIRAGRYEDMADRATRFVRDSERPGVATIEGNSPPYRVVADTERLVLLSMEVRDESGQVKMRAEASDFVEGAPGFWMPSRIEWIQAESGGVVRCEARLSKIQANGDLPVSLFVPNLPSGTTRIEKE